MHLEMLIQMRLLQKFFIAFTALIRKGQTVRLHVRMQLRLQLEVLLWTPRTIVASDAGMRLQMLI